MKDFLRDRRVGIRAAIIGAIAIVFAAILSPILTGVIDRINSQYESDLRLTEIAIAGIGTSTNISNTSSGLPLTLTPPNIESSPITNTIEPLATPTPLLTNFPTLTQTVQAVQAFVFDEVGRGFWLRLGAGTDHQAIGRVHNGTSVTIISEPVFSKDNQEWVLVQTNDNEGVVIGWLPLSSLTTVIPSLEETQT